MSHGLGRRTALFLGAAFVLTFFAAVGEARAAKDEWYTQHYIIMQDFERKAYKSLSAAGKQAFQEIFWQSRAPNAKEEFAARLEFVKKNYWKENSRQPWNTDRGRTFLLNGSPVSIDYDQNTDWGSLALPGQMPGAGTNRTGEDVSANRAEIWTYPFNQNFIKYVFVFVRPNEWRIVPTAVGGSRYLQELETYNKTVVFGVQNPEQYNESIAALEKKK